MASKRFGLCGIAIAIGLPRIAAVILKNKDEIKKPQGSLKKYLKRIPTRDQQIIDLKSDSQYDVLIIGGGSLGCSCALDATTRGLKTAMIDANDFASGNTSRSSKILHGGISYLEQSLSKVDRDLYQLSRDFMREREILMKSAPHLVNSLPLMLPIYDWKNFFYYWLGIKIFDVVAGPKLIKPSKLISKNEALGLFPLMEIYELCGAVIFYDGIQDNTRSCLSKAMTAARHGAQVANHVEVIELVKRTAMNGTIIVSGVKVRDNMTQQEWIINAKCIINASGPFTDCIRNMDGRVVDMNRPVLEVHISLPVYFNTKNVGLIKLQDDKPAMYFLPWHGQTIVNTTDTKCQMTTCLTPTEEDIKKMCQQIKRFLAPQVKINRDEVLSAWMGVQTSIIDPNKDTQQFVEHHVVHISPTKLITIAGGHSTIHRQMAEKAIDKAIYLNNLKPRINRSITKYLQLEGGHFWTPTMDIKISQEFGVDPDVAKHLIKTYGDRASAVVRMAALSQKNWPLLGKRLHPDYPFIEAEVRYGIREYACTASDMIARRLSLAFQDTKAAYEILPAIVDIMAEELKWSRFEKKKQMKQTEQYLMNEMLLKCKTIPQKETDDILETPKNDKDLHNITMVHSRTANSPTITNLINELKSKTFEQIEDEVVETVSGMKNRIYSFFGIDDDIEIPTVKKR